MGVFGKRPVFDVRVLPPAESLVRLRGMTILGSKRTLVWSDRAGGDSVTRLIFIHVVSYCVHDPDHFVPERQTLPLADSAVKGMHV